MHYHVYNRPENKSYLETPARFTWMPVEGAEQYTIHVYDEHHALVYQYDNVPTNFYTPPEVMAPGSYTYSITAGDREIASRLPFSIGEDAVQTPLPPRGQRYGRIGTHPRIWLDEAGVTRLKERARGDLCKEWDTFVEQAVDIWQERPVGKEPAFYPDNKRVISLWRQMYIDCQEALYAVKHSAVAWKATGDRTYLERAKRWLMAIAGWDVEGSTARAYNDESAFRVTTALAWGYDWLYNDLSAEERRIVKRALLARGRELFDYVTNQIEIHVKLLDSHGVRSLSMTLIPAALALYGEEPEATAWLDYTIEYFSTIFTPWGGDDGGWAEGPTYWQSGVSFFTEAICLIRQATGINIFERPFFQHTGDFPLYTYCQDMRFMATCDMSDLGDYPGLKAGYTMRILSAASASGNKGQYAWYFEQAKKRNAGTEGLFYNYGWWNFEFDELFFRMQFAPVTPEAPQKGVTVKHFRDIGWFCIHKDMAEEENHLAFLFKSSPYGCVSHSHGDQNSFTLHAFGEPLAIHSGYYIGFWSDMHTKWRRQTKSKNAVLVDGTGQFADLRRTTAAEDLNGSAKSQFENLIASSGHMEACEQYQSHVYVRGDCTAAFKQSLPYVISNKRHVLFVQESFFVIIDEVELEQAGKIDWMLHALSPFVIGDNTLTLQRPKAGMDVHFIGAPLDISQSDCFDGVPTEETVGLEPQWHLTATTRQAAASHRIISVLYAYANKKKEALTVADAPASCVHFRDKCYFIRRDGERYTID